MRNVTEYGQGTDIPFDPDAVGVYHQTLSSMQVVDEEVRVTWHGSMCDRISSFEAVMRDGAIDTCGCARTRIFGRLASSSFALSFCSAAAGSPARHKASPVAAVVVHRCRRVNMPLLEGETRLCRALYRRRMGAATAIRG